jgi:hypothetical protein
MKIPISRAAPGIISMNAKSWHCNAKKMHDARLEWINHNLIEHILDTHKRRKNGGARFNS